MINSSLDAEKISTRCQKIPFQEIQLIIDYNRKIVSKVICSEKYRCKIENLEEDFKWRCLFEKLELEQFELFKKISDIPIKKDLTRCRRCGYLIIPSRDYKEEKIRARKQPELMEFHKAVQIKINLNGKEIKTFACENCSNKLENYMIQYS